MMAAKDKVVPPAADAVCCGGAIVCPSSCVCPLQLRHGHLTIASESSSYCCFRPAWALVLTSS
jgi:hypothetical protein